MPRAPPRLHAAAAARDGETPSGRPQGPDVARTPMTSCYRWIRPETGRPPAGRGRSPCGLLKAASCLEPGPDLASGPNTGLLRVLAVGVPGEVARDLRVVSRLGLSFQRGELGQPFPLGRRTVCLDP